MRLEKDLRYGYTFTNHVTFKMEGIYIGRNLTGYTINSDDIGLEIYNPPRRGPKYTFFI